MRALALIVGLAAALLAVPAAHATPRFAAGADGSIVQFGPRVSTTERLALITAAGGHYVETLPFRAVLVRGLSRREAARLARDGRVRSIEGNHRRQLLDWVPNDPKFTLDRSKKPLQWHLPLIGAPAAWNLDAATGGGGYVGAGTMIAVIDSGVDAVHPELTGRVIRGKNYVDNDFRSDVDIVGHGTAIASLAAGTGGNGINGVGVAPRSLIYAIKIGNPNSFTTDAKIGAAIREATVNGADVMNLSFGGGPKSSYIRNALKFAAANDVLAVCASGNESARSVAFPASDPNCFAVGATTFRDKRSSFSNAGRALDLVAPGERLTISANPLKDGNDVEQAGTSFATPLVVGVAAQLRGRGLSRAEIITALTTTAVDLGKPGWDVSYGHGRLNAEAALRTTIGRGPKSPETPAKPQCLAADGFDPVILYQVFATSSVPVFCFDANYDLLTHAATGQGGATVSLAADFPYSGIVRLQPDDTTFTTGTFGLTASDAVGPSDAVTVTVGVPPDPMTAKRAKQFARAYVPRKFGRKPFILTDRKCTRLNGHRAVCPVEGGGSGGLYFGDALVASELVNGRSQTLIYFAGWRYSKACIKRDNPDDCAVPVSFQA